MTYETVVADLHTRLPQISDQHGYLADNPPSPYLVFGSVLIPALESALEAADLASILRICAFLEDAAEAAETDAALRTLLQIEVGEWLDRTAKEDLLCQWLGEKTKRICGYVPGLATQRRALKAKQEKESLRSRLSSLLNRLRAR